LIFFVSSEPKTSANVLNILTVCFFLINHRSWYDSKKQEKLDVLL
jgi:hypothetical protein